MEAWRKVLSKTPRQPPKFNDQVQSFKIGQLVEPRTQPAWLEPNKEYLLRLQTIILCPPDFRSKGKTSEKDETSYQLCTKEASEVRC